MIEKAKIPEGAIEFETGAMTKDEIESVLEALPIDITFVDKDDTVRYFNKPGNGSSSGQRRSSGSRSRIATRKKALTR